MKHLKVIVASVALAASSAAIADWFDSDGYHDGYRDSDTRHHRCRRRTADV